MRLLDIIAQTLRTLWAHKLRSFLTMFGIAWGVGSLLLLVGLGEGFRSGNRRQLSQIGENIAFIFPGRISAAPGSHVPARPYFLTYGDVAAIRAEAPDIDRVTPVLQRGDIRSVSEFQSSNGQVFGVEYIYNQIRHIPMGSGRWFNKEDDDQGRMVAVLGQQMERLLFPGEASVGATIVMNGQRFLVIGILESTGRDEGNQAGQRVYLPYKTMAQYFPIKGENVPGDAVNFINYRPASRAVHKQATEEAHKIIARRHSFSVDDEDAWESWDTARSEEMVGKIFTAMNLFLGSVGVVTLALGGIGIVNIMLVSVSERTKEIGLRKALGATNRSIMMQFFMEGAFLTLLSGGLGIGAAAGLMTMLAQLPAPPGFDTPRLVPWSAALAVGSLALAGISAGLYPARQASLLTPVEALRQEQ
jgi:putative ABC transport system permease protein